MESTDFVSILLDKAFNFNFTNSLDDTEKGKLKEAYEEDNFSQYTYIIIDKVLQVKKYTISNNDARTKLVAEIEKIPAACKTILNIKPQQKESFILTAEFLYQLASSIDVTSADDIEY